jgi:methylated-DNA-protein-cysteine methyltransferase-like protein
MSPEVSFKDRVELLMSRVPYGHVVTYGDLAALAGQAHASRVVGGIAHFGNPDLPWHRLVNRFGGLASGFHGGREVQKELLAQEGITCTNMIVDEFNALRWRFDGGR